MRIAVIALVAAVAVCYVDAWPSFLERLANIPPYTSEMRERLGHMNDNEYLNLYKTYVAAKLDKRDRIEPDEAYRHYTPTGPECMVFLGEFDVMGEKLQRVEDLVKLDACLGYLFEAEQYHDKDFTTVISKSGLNDYKQKASLRAIYDGTKVAKFEEPAAACLSNLLYNNLVVNYNLYWTSYETNRLQTLIQFAECHDSIKQDPSYSEEDTYMKILYELVKQSAAKCFENEFATMHDRVGSGFLNRYKKDLRTLLSTFQDTKTEVNAREIIMFLKAMQTTENTRQNTAGMREVQMERLGKAARKHGKFPEGVEVQDAYDKYIRGLCIPFWPSPSTVNTDKDLATPIIRLVEMTRYEPLLGISEAKFIEHFVARTNPASRFYLALGVCNVLQHTHASMERILVSKSGKVQSAFKKFRDPKNFIIHVAFKPNAHEKMIKWPLLPYY